MSFPSFFVQNVFTIYIPGKRPQLPGKVSRFGKTSRRAQEGVDGAELAVEHVAEDEQGVCVYHCENEMQSCFRPDTKKFRFSHQIPPCEGANVIVKVLEDSSKRLKKDPVYYAFIAELGYKKSGSDLRELFRKSLKYALEAGLVSKTRSCTYYI